MRFESNVRMPRGLSWFVHGLAAFMMAVVIALAVLRPESWQYGTIVCALFALALLAFARLTHVTVRVLDDRVVLAYLPFGRAALQLSEIAHVEPVIGERLVSRFGGTGYRIASRGGTGFIAGPGPAIRLRTHRGRTYTASTDQPHEATEAIHHAQQHQAPHRAGSHNQRHDHREP